MWHHLEDFLLHVAHHAYHRYTIIEDIYYRIFEQIIGATIRWTVLDFDLLHSTQHTELPETGASTPQYESLEIRRRNTFNRLKWKAQREGKLVSIVDEKDDGGDQG